MLESGGRVQRNGKFFRRALIYVLANIFKHGGRAEGSKIDTFSTAPWFPFDDQHHEHPLKQRRKPAAEPKTWLLRKIGRAHV